MLGGLLAETLLWAHRKNVPVATTAWEAAVQAINLTEDLSARIRAWLGLLDGILHIITLFWGNPQLDCAVTAKHALLGLLQSSLVLYAPLFHMLYTLAFMLCGCTCHSQLQKPC